MTIFHYVNGTFVPEKEAYVSALDLSVLRGYGVFDYVQIYQGKAFHLQDHLERFKWSAEQVELTFPWDLSSLSQLVDELLAKNPPIDAGVRLLLTGGPSGQDQLLPETAPQLILLFHPYTPPPERYYTKGMRALTTNLLRIIPGVKTTNYMPAIFAMNRAKKTGFDDAIYLNGQEELLEGTISNLFFFKNGKLITSDSNSIVKGVTRAILLQLAAPYFPIEFRSLPLSEVSSCQEAFLCSSRKEVAPLVQIDDKIIGSGKPGPCSAKLLSLFQNYVANYFAETHQPSC
ncbi:MAG TPA: amino acid aminotransferase [Parachlamydiales bacterium]|nr:amino acid aminotransferase [Parachlamydiales bacterium]